MTEPSAAGGAPDLIYDRFYKALADVEAGARPTLDDMIKIIDGIEAQKCSSARVIVMAGYAADFPDGSLYEIAVLRKVLAVLVMFKANEFAIRNLVQSKQPKKRRA